MLLLLLPVLLLSAQPIKAQSLAEYLERDWHGFYKGYSDVFTDGEYYLQYQMFNVIASDVDNSFTATMTGVINIEGTLYNATWAVTGSITSDYNVYLNYNYTVSSDALPEGLTWIYGNLTGELYSDSESEGDLIIKGTSGISAGDSFELVTFVEN